MAFVYIMFLVIATLGYLLSLFVLIFLCHATCRCGDGISVACSVGVFRSSCSRFSCVRWAYQKPIFGDDIVVIYVLILFTEFRDVSLYGATCFSLLIGTTQECK
jgi:hypothetical protein